MRLSTAYLTTVLVFVGLLSTVTSMPLVARNPPLSAEPTSLVSTLVERDTPSKSELTSPVSAPVEGKLHSNYVLPLPLSTQKVLQGVKAFIEKYPNARMTIGFYSKDITHHPHNDPTMINKAQELVSAWFEQELGPEFAKQKVTFNQFTTYPNSQLEEPVQFYAFFVEHEMRTFYIGGVSPTKEGGHVLGIMRTYDFSGSKVTLDRLTAIHSLETQEESQIQRSDMDKLRSWISKGSVPVKH
ncbi:hypothetical protein FB446DRAFT_424731 [Lentinula raphanica]|nr:hypothetical protein FB446DRAFT_424731 [Lentinula raphanica]